MNTTRLTGRKNRTTFVQVSEIDLERCSKDMERSTVQVPIPDKVLDEMNELRKDEELVRQQCEKDEAEVNNTGPCYEMASKFLFHSRFHLSNKERVRRFYFLPEKSKDFTWNYYCDEALIRLKNLHAEFTQPDAYPSEGWNETMLIWSFNEMDWIRTAIEAGDQPAIQKDMITLLGDEIPHWHSTIHDFGVFYSVKHNEFGYGFFAVFPRG